MPKSRVTKRAKRKKAARQIRKNKGVPVAELLGMIHALEGYENAMSEPILDIDGEAYLTPEQMILIQQLQEDEKKESEDAE